MTWYNSKRPSGNYIRWQVLFFGFVFCLLSGCGGLIISHVTVFHVLPQNPPPTKYAFIPLEGQEGGLEYSAYKSLISAELSKYQYEEVPLDEATVVVTFNYTIEGKEKVGSAPVVGQTGGGTTSYSGIGSQGIYFGEIYTPATYGIKGYRAYSYTEHTRRVWLHMVDKASLDAQKPKVLYEANVLSEGSSGQIAKVMPTIIKALFKEFPGESGSTRKEIMPLVKPGGDKRKQEQKQEEPEQQEPDPYAG